MRTEEQSIAAFNGMKASEVATELQCSRAHVIDLIKVGALRAVDISVGSRAEYRISRESFQTFLEDRDALECLRQRAEEEDAVA